MLNNFEYHRPNDLTEIHQLMIELPEAQILAGGTDLLPDIDVGVRHAHHVISLSKLSELKRIQEFDSKISIGAACTAREIQLSSLIQRCFPEIVEMVPRFASPQIRTRATIGGNICSAVPCGDFPVILIALGAEVELASQKGNRIVLLKDFFVGPRETVREKTEILTRILVPQKPPTSMAYYAKFQRRASNSLAVASVASFLDIQNGICRNARIVLGAVAPVPVFAEKAGMALVGKRIENEVIEQAASFARDDTKPITDIRGTKDYRREIIYILTKRAIRRAAGKLVNQRERK